MNKKVLTVTKNGTLFMVGQIKEVGFSSVSITSIEYHEPLGDGDRHYVDIYYSDGPIVSRFNIDSVCWKSTEDT